MACPFPCSFSPFSSGSSTSVNAETGRAVASLLCVSSGDGSAFASSAGQVLLDLQLSGRWEDSESELVNSQLLLGKANHCR